MGDGVDLLWAEVLHELESGVLRVGVVDGALNDEVGDIVGEVVAAHVIVVYKMHALTCKQNIQVVEIIVAESDGRLSGRQ
jgi:hypothetical protein